VAVGGGVRLIYLHVMMVQRVDVVLLTGHNTAGRLCSAWFPVMPLRTGDPACHVGPRSNVSGRTVSNAVASQESSATEAGCLPACVSACLMLHRGVAMVACC
jgi:hypothetical protein